MILTLEAVKEANESVDYLLHWKPYIEIIAAIGTFVSAIIALFTLTAVKKQRLATYKPELFLHSFCVVPTSSPLFSIDRVRYKTTKYNDYSGESNLEKFHPSILYKLENLGFGVASEIECQWQFDFNIASQKLKSILPNEYELKFHNKYFFLHRKGNEDFVHSASVNAILEKDIQKVDFIAPLQVKEHYSKHTIPEVIFFMYYLDVVFRNNLFSGERSKNFYHIADIPMPKPILTASYKDLNNKRYKKKFQLDISCSVTQLDEYIETSKEFCVFYFNVTSI